MHQSSRLKSNEGLFYVCLLAFTFLEVGTKRREPYHTSQEILQYWHRCPSPLSWLPGKALP
jgi:hypothetical protein